jgi:excisionase family DNA binding protein
MPRKLLTTSEVAERLRKPPSTLRYYRHVGIGPRSARVGRTVLYDEADVDAWVEAQFARDERGV